jgi:hypothetical protein
MTGGGPDFHPLAAVRAIEDIFGVRCAEDPDREEDDKEQDRADNGRNQRPKGGDDQSNQQGRTAPPHGEERLEEVAGVGGNCPAHAANELADA